MKTLRLFVIITALSIATISCSDQVQNEKASIEFRLTDMPGEYQQVNVEITAIKVLMNDSIIELETNEGVYNLLEFVNGKDTLIVDDEIPSGYITQVRLILGENNSVMVDSVVHELKTPSAQQSGLKLNVHEEFVAGEAYAFVVDFVVEKSVHQTGNGKYILKPVIRVFSEAVHGSISGVVSPAEAKAYVEALNDVDTVGTFADTTSGYFKIRGLSEGVYSLDIDALDGFKDTVITDITVIPGQQTKLDTIFLN